MDICAHARMRSLITYSDLSCPVTDAIQHHQNITVKSESGPVPTPPLIPHLPYKLQIQKYLSSPLPERLPSNIFKVSLVCEIIAS